MPRKNKKKKKDPVIDLAEDLAISAMTNGPFRDVTAEELAEYCLALAVAILEGPEEEDEEEED